MSKTISAIIAILLIGGFPATSHSQSPEQFIGKFFEKAIGNLGKAKKKTSNIQKRLAILGFYDDEIDGKYGPATTAAVKEYQRSIGARPTGRLTKAQRRRLGRDARRARENGDVEVANPAQENGDVKVARPAHDNRDDDECANFGPKDMYGRPYSSNVRSCRYERRRRREEKV